MTLLFVITLCIVSHVFVVIQWNLSEFFFIDYCYYYNLELFRDGFPPSSLPFPLFHSSDEEMNEEERKIRRRLAQTGKSGEEVN